jgi:2-dehydro-3-deoxyphosphooctonate aldolase (KDO 8-P synthase)
MHLAKQTILQLGNMRIGNTLPMIIVGGMNVLESEELALRVAAEFKRVCGSLSTRPIARR